MLNELWLQTQTKFIDSMWLEIYHILCLSPLQQPVQNWPVHSHTCASGALCCASSILMEEISLINHTCNWMQHGYVVKIKFLLVNKYYSLLQEKKNLPQALARSGHLYIMLSSWGTGISTNHIKAEMIHVFLLAYCYKKAMERCLIHIWKIAIISGEM